MPRSRNFINRKRCTFCKRILRYCRGQMKIIKCVRDAEMFGELLRTYLNISDALCGCCRTRALRQSARTHVQGTVDEDTHAPDEAPVLQLAEMSLSDDTLSDSTNDPAFRAAICDTTVKEVVSLPFCRTVATHKYCCVCYTKEGSLVVVPLSARIQTFKKRRMYIPKGNRCCPQHLIHGRFYDENLNKMQAMSPICEVEPDEVAVFLNEVVDQNEGGILHEINSLGLPRKRLEALTGYSLDHIITLRDMLQSMRNTDNRSVFLALFVFLFKLRSGNSNNIIAAIFGIERPQCISEYCQSVLNALKIDVFPTKFGVFSCRREDLIANHTSPYVKKLHGFEGQLVLVADGTYLRHGKSSNNWYQRKSYSGQKKMSLCKPFSVCTTDGYIVDTFGPFLGTFNDATIMKLILDDLRPLLLPGDVFVVDRGFRDVRDFLRSEGFEVLMPALKGNKKQLTTKEANESRFVTKLRWVVEAIHGIIGTRFKLLHNQFDNKMLPQAAAYCKTACFLVNYFGKRLTADVDLFQEISDFMIHRKDVVNSLATSVEENNWNRKKKTFQLMTAEDLCDFPEMTMRELKILFGGSYQLSQVTSYLGELIGEDGSINLLYMKETGPVLKCEVQSRHITRKQYKVYITYEPHSTGRSGITGYACDCPNGLRTVGCCVHIATVIYYLSYARYLSEILRPANILTDVFSGGEIVPADASSSDEE